MAAPKFSPSQLAALYKDKSHDKNLHEKKSVEQLIEKLNGQIQKDPKLAKKAALVLEHWLNKKSKP